MNQSLNQSAFDGDLAACGDVVDESATACEISKERCVNFYKELFRLLSWSNRLNIRFERHDIEVPSICRIGLGAMPCDKADCGCPDGIYFVWDTIDECEYALGFTGGLETKRRFNSAIRDMESDCEYPQSYVTDDGFRMVEDKLPAITSTLEDLDVVLIKKVALKREANARLRKLAAQSLKNSGEVAPSV